MGSKLCAIIVLLAISISATFASAGALAAATQPATKPIQQPAAAGEVEIGMTEAECDRIALAKHWTKAVTEKATDGTGIEYRSPVGWSSGFREKDICWFVDGKLVRVELIRAPNH